jgi:hypothetical protein
MTGDSSPAALMQRIPAMGTKSNNNNKMRLVFIKSPLCEMLELLYIKFAGKMPVFSLFFHGMRLNRHKAPTSNLVSSCRHTRSGSRTYKVRFPNIMDIFSRHQPLPEKGREHQELLSGDDRFWKEWHGYLPENMHGHGSLCTRSGC